MRNVCVQVSVAAHGVHTLRVHAGHMLIYQLAVCCVRSRTPGGSPTDAARGSVQIELYKSAGRDSTSPDFSVDDMILGQS